MKSLAFTSARWHDWTLPGGRSKNGLTHYVPLNDVAVCVLERQRGLGSDWQQSFTIWKNVFNLGQRAAEIALELAAGKQNADIDGTFRFSGGPQGVELDSFLLPVDRIDRTNLDKVVDVGWATRDRICAGVTDNPPAVCQ